MKSYKKFNFSIKKRDVLLRYLWQFSDTLKKGEKNKGKGRDDTNICRDRVLRVQI